MKPVTPFVLKCAHSGITDKFLTVEIQNESHSVTNI